MTRFFPRSLVIALLIASVFASVRAAQRATPSLAYRIVATHPHSTEMFTEGLVFVDGELYESAGRKGYSRICRVDVASGAARACAALTKEFFGEGIAAVGARILQLTWREGTGFVYDRELRRRGSFRYDGEGWGLTYDGTHLLMSDGSASLRVLDADSYRERRRIAVTDAGQPLLWINELEYARGRIWANGWHSDRIAVIDAARGEVAAWLDLGELRRRFNKPPDWNEAESVLNGIAYDPRNDHFYVTGKYWPVLFELEVDNAVMRATAPR